MKREKLNTMKERDLLVGLITSNKFCQEIVPILNPRHLEVEYARIIAGWIKDFYNKFKVAPQKDIIKLYRSKCEEITDESLQDNVLTFIERLDKDYESMSSFNDEFLLNESIEYLKSQQLKNLNDDIQAYISTGEISKAENLITKFRTVEKNSGKCVSIFNSSAVISSFAEENEILFTLPGAYGKVIGDIHREDFIGFLAPMKRGKTWILIDVGVNAMMNGLKVLHVSLEMSEGQNLKRYWTCISGQVDKDKEITIPFFDELGDRFNIDHRTIQKKASTIEEIESKQKSIKKYIRGGEIRIFAVPSYSLTVEALDVELDRLEIEENFVPDVILVDYADILKPSEKADYRNQLDGIWKRLRGMAQSRKCALFTASQSGRASISKDVEAEDIAEDIRKLAHVTSMVSLNQTKQQKQDGILRLKQLAVREGEQEFREAVCLQCLSLGRMVMDSKFGNEVILKKEKNEDSDDDEDIKRRKR